MKNNIQKELPKHCESIDELFSLWKVSHNEDYAEKCRNCIFPCFGNRKQDDIHNICKSDRYNIIRESFLPDGSLSDQKRDEHKILFVCKEAHNDFKDKSADFWMKKTKDSNDKYHKCIREIASAFDADLEECAYMNINKRGGHDWCNLTRLRDYSITYSEFIQEEISLLKPQRIIVLGKNIPSETLEIFKEALDIFNVNDIYPEHPSFYTKKTLNDFKECAVIKNLVSEWENLTYEFYSSGKQFVNEFNNTLKRTYFLSRKYLLNDFALPEQFRSIIDKMRDYIDENTIEYSTDDCIKEYYIAAKNVTAEFVQFLLGPNTCEASDFCYYYVQLFLHYYDENGKAILEKEFPNLSFPKSDINEVLNYIQLLKER